MTENLPATHLPHLVGELPFTAESRPRTSVVTVFAVYRSAAADVLLPVKIVVPWKHVADVSRIDFTFHVPDGFESDIVFGEPANLLCSWRTVRTAVSRRGDLLASPISATVASSGDPFTFGLKFPSDSSGTGLSLGVSGEQLTVTTYGRVRPHAVAADSGSHSR